MSNDPVHARLHFAIALADEVAARILRVYRPSGVRFDTKADGSPVTIADRDAESHIRARVDRAFPGDAFLGEEFGESPGNSGFRWIVDPIDGTRAFVHGVPLFGTLIGIERNGRMVAGVLNLPALAGGELLYAAVSEGCWHRTGDAPPQRCRVSPVASLSEGLVCMTAPADLHLHGMAPAFERLARAAKSLRGWGDCFAFAMVATGRAEASIDVKVHPWDVAALIPIITEAGGTITDFAGRTSTDAPSCITTNGRVLPELLAILGGLPPG